MPKKLEQEESFADKVLGALEKFSPLNLIDDSNLAHALRGPMLGANQEMTKILESKEDKKLSIDRSTQADLFQNDYKLPRQNNNFSKNKYNFAVVKKFLS